LGLRFSESSLNSSKNDSFVIRSPGRYAAYYSVYKSQPKLKNSVVEIPIEFGYKFKPFKTLIPFLSLGASISDEVSSITASYKPDYIYFRVDPGNEGLPESWLKEGLPDSPTFNPIERDGKINYLNLSLFGGLGLRKEFKSKWALEGTIRYHSKFSSLIDGKYQTIASTIQRLEINFNVLHRF
jgi:hypothetical protein